MDNFVVTWPDSFVQAYHNQSQYREVPQWEIFMEQEMRFGLDLGQLRLLKEKKWTDYEQLLRSFFSLSHEQSFPLVC